MTTRTDTLVSREVPAAAPVGGRSPDPLAMTIPKEPRAGGDDEVVLIISSGDSADKLCEALRASDEDATTVEVLETDSPTGGRELPSVERIREAIYRHGITDVVVDPEIEASGDIVSALIACKLQGVRIRDTQDFFEDFNHRIWLDGLRAEWLLFSDGFDQPRAYRIAKRWFDVLATVVLSILTAPLMACIAIAIKLDSPGPVLFKQERVGQNGEVFTLYKFRSMSEDAEQETGPVWARPDDDRVTRVGAVLRKCRLDELPQFINVLRNDISLVGPRPERPCFVAELSEKVPFYHFRQLLEPGVTGWAQICKGYTDSIEGACEKLEYDLYYAKHASFLFDLEILLRTVGVVFFRKGR